ncbi:30S ribosomal protein S5 [Patescibacteria group bacterium]|nr:30S ribosomal protein S5 [Patescibacteria group bacterium]MDE2021437.1 30S ribosomal protein S5 [Patescibacteria group bacterium]MDE2172991.1 30S ribosomal protein S5 [Patescibacteria group bacterium]
MDTTILEPRDTQEAATDAPVSASPEEAAPAAAEQTAAAHGRGSLRGRARTPRGGARARPPRERGEFEQVTIDARRVARVMAGGRRFSFSLVVVIGDKKGRVGVGLGKGVDTALAIDKATRDAKKNLLTIVRTATGSVPHQVRAKYGSSIVEVIPSKGRGLVAGSAMRTVLDLGGVTDVVAKIHTRSKNKLTIARATVAALRMLSAE